MSAVEDKKISPYAICIKCVAENGRGSSNNIAHGRMFSRAKARGPRHYLPPRSAANSCRQFLPGHASATENRYWVTRTIERPTSYRDRGQSGEPRPLCHLSDVRDANRPTVDTVVGVASMRGDTTLHPSFRIWLCRSFTQKRLQRLRRCS